jgi:hypothetical protein
MTEWQMVQIERLRVMAREAVDEYQAALLAGEEPSYPQWADDILAVCDQAEVGLMFRGYSKTHVPAPGTHPRHVM